MELETFVSQYAKKDKSFEIILKAHFVSRLITGDSMMKYHKILSEVIRPKTLSNPKISASTKRTINVILEDFSHQMSDLLSIEDYQESSFIIINSLDKIAYLQNSYEIKDKSVDKLRMDFLDGLEIILKQNLAPKFRSEIDNLLLTNVRKSYYLPTKKNLIRLMDEHNVFSEADKTELLEELINKMTKESDQQNIIITMIQLASPFPNLANKLLDNIGQDKIFLALSDLVKQRKFELVEFMIEHKEVKYMLHKTAISCMILHQKGDYKALTQELRCITTSNTPILVIKDVVEHLCYDYLRQEIHDLHSWIEELPFGMRCSLYAKARYFEKLVAALKKNGEVEWLKVYDTLLIEQGHRDLVQELYLHCSSTYLEDHMGAKAAEYMSRINHRLVSISEHKMLTQIQESLYERFSQRMNT